MLKLYTDESPGLKVDPVVVLVLSVVFIISVVALHSEFPLPSCSRYSSSRWEWSVDRVVELACVVAAVGAFAVGVYNWLNYLLRS